MELAAKVVVAFVVLYLEVNESTNSRLFTANGLLSQSPSFKLCKTPLHG
ncbi:hypothetical protein THERMOT_486 [Bathymodiolus thermophilus thioautotrophic gill symbiont]|nr:hypothetical protein THERMOT_486 [Bathymodiolus thermophilus thioautotrophic gill symbiont]